MTRFWLLLAALAVLGASAVAVLPHAGHSLALRLATDDPATLADLRLSEVFDTEWATQEIEAALAADDVELAESFLALADQRDVTVAPELRARMETAGSGTRELRRTASRFGRGLITGEPDGAAGLAGAAVGDLFVFGDVRDLAREGSRWVRGQEVDPLITGLAAVGLAATAGTYLVSGAGAPARAGISLFKAARRGGKLTASLAADTTRLLRSGRSGRVAAGLADLGRVESKAGARAALDGLRYSDDIADLGRVGKLAEKNGRSTLAILKTLGRGALVLGGGALTAGLWVMGAATNIFLLTVTLCTLLAWLVRRFWAAARFATVRIAARV